MRQTPFCQTLAHFYYHYTPSLKKELGYTGLPVSVCLSTTNIFHHIFLRNHTSHPFETWNGMSSRGPTCHLSTNTEFSLASHLRPASQLGIPWVYSVSSNLHVSHSDPVYSVSSNLQISHSDPVYSVSINLQISHSDAVYSVSINLQISHSDAVYSVSRNLQISCSDPV